MKKRYLLAGLSGVVAGAVATKLLTRPRDVSWPESLDFIYNPEYSWFTRVNGARTRAQAVMDEGLCALEPFGAKADALRALARYTVECDR